MTARDNRLSPTPHFEDDAFPSPRPFSSNHSCTMRSTDAQSPTPRTARPMPKTSYARTVLHRRRLFSRRRRSVDIIVAIAIVAALAAVASCAFFTWKQAEVYAASQQSGPLNSSNVSDSGTSTPKSEWRQGEVPMLFQTDLTWGSSPYAGSDIATAGCGPTCLSMVYVALTGKTDLGPAEMASFSERNGFVQDGMTAWALMTDGAAQLGISAEELSASEGTLLAALEEGKPVIASMLPGDFTTEGHFIVIVSVDSSGKLVVRDPNSAERSAQAWDAQTILAQCANLWAYSVGANSPQQ